MSDNFSKSSGDRKEYKRPAPTGHHANGNGALVIPHPAIADRLPPQNLEAERGVLGGILKDPEELPKVAEILAVTDFYRDVHQLFYAAILALRDRGIPADGITVPDEMMRRGDWDKAGGYETLHEICESVPHGALTVYHAGIVHERAMARNVIDVHTVGLRDGYSNQFTALELLDRATSSLASIGGGGGSLAGYEPKTFGAIARAVGALDHLWRDWLILGNLSMVYSRPKAGKTRVYIRIIKTLWFAEDWADGAPNTWPAGTRTIVLPYDRNHTEIEAEMRLLGIPDEAALCPHDPRDPLGVGLLSLTDPLMLAILDRILSRDRSIRLIVIDTLTYASEKSLSKPEDMKAILDGVMTLAMRYAVALLVLIHDNKEGLALGRRIEERARVLMKLERYDESDPKRLRFWVYDANGPGRPALTAIHTDHGIDFRPDSGAIGDGATRRDACARWLVGYLRGRTLFEADYGTLINAAGEAGFAGGRDEKNRWKNPNLLSRAIKAINDKDESLAELRDYSIGERREPRSDNPKDKIFYRLEGVTLDFGPVPEVTDRVPF